jgi:hypothetical protein
MRFCRNGQARQSCTTRRNRPRGSIEHIEAVFQSRMNAIGAQYGRRYSLLARLRQANLMK